MKGSLIPAIPSTGHVATQWRALRIDPEEWGPTHVTQLLRGSPSIETVALVNSCQCGRWIYSSVLACGGW